MECDFLLQGSTLGELSNTQAGEQGTFDEHFRGDGGITTLWVKAPSRFLIIDSLEPNLEE